MTRSPRTLFNLEENLPAVRKALETELCLKTSQIKQLGIPSAEQAACLELLESEGYERFKGGVRKPLAVQLEIQLKDRSLLSGPVGRFLKGGSPAEYKRLLEDFLRSGRMCRVLRGRAQVLVSPGLGILSREELQKLKNLSGLVSLAKKAIASRSLPLSLLRDDVLESLEGLPCPESHPGGSASLQDLLLARARECIHRETGLCFVPDLVASLLDGHGLADIHTGLWTAVHHGHLELRPESGMNRLSRAETLLCPVGLRDCRMSWARIVEEGP